MTVAGSRTMHRTSLVIIFTVLVIFSADSTMSSRKKILYDHTKEAANCAEPKSEDKTKDGHERLARTLNVRRIIDTFVPFNQDGTDSKEKRFGPTATGTVAVKQNNEDLVPLEKSVDGPMPIYDDDIEAVDPLQGLLPQKYWEERDDEQQASLINDFFRKNVHNQMQPFYTAVGSDAVNKNNNFLNKPRREFVGETKNNKNFINNVKPENGLNKAIPLRENYKKHDGQYHAEDNFSPNLLVTGGGGGGGGVNQPMALNNQYSSDTRSPLTADGYSIPDYDKALFLQTADPLAGTEHIAADDAGRNAGSGLVFFSEPRRATDISPLNSNLADGIGKIVDTIMKDVIVSNLKNDQQRASPSPFPSCDNGEGKTGELVITSLVEKAFPPLSSRGTPPLESVFSLNAGSDSNKADIRPARIQKTFNSGRKLLFFHNKDKKYPMPVKTKTSKISLISQNKEAKKDNLNSSLHNVKLQSTNNSSGHFNAVNSLYTNPGYPSHTNTLAKDTTESNKDKFGRLKNIHDYQKYLNMIKNTNRGNEENKSQNSLPLLPSSSKVETATKTQNTNDNNNNSQNKDNNLQHIEQVNYLLNMQHKEDEKKNKNGLLGLQTSQQPPIEYKIDDLANRLKQQQQDGNHQAVLPDGDNYKINEDRTKYKLEPSQDQNSQPVLSNTDNNFKYPLMPNKPNQIPLPVVEEHDRPIPPNNNSGPEPPVPVPGNELLQQMMKHANKNPPSLPDNTGNAYQMKKPESGSNEQPTNADNTYKTSVLDNEQHNQPNSQTVPTAVTNDNGADPALMIEEINKFILERKAKLESLSEFIGRLRLKKLEDMSTKSNGATLSKNRRQVDEHDVGKDEKDFLNKNNNDKYGDKSVGFSDEDVDTEINGGRFLSEDQNLSENVNILGSSNNITLTEAVTTSAHQTSKQTNRFGLQVQNNATTVGNNQTPAANNVTMQTTMVPTTMTANATTMKVATSVSGVTQPLSDLTKRPVVSDEELESLNINMSNRIVDRIFQRADQTENMRANLGLCRKSDSVKSLKASDKVLPESEAVLKQVLECIRGLIQYQLQKQTCNVLDKELYEFLKWMLLTGEAKHGTDYLTRQRKHGAVKSDFLFHNECGTTSTPCETSTGGSGDNKLNSRLHRMFA